MDFAPYQSSPPEAARPFSPQTSPRASLERQNPRRLSPSMIQHPQPQRTGWPAAAAAALAASPPPPPTPPPLGGAIHREGVSEFDTSLGIRLDYEACLAYLALPPLGGIFLLIVERNSDYVRFHAWQSALLFTGMFILQLLLWWSSFLGWVLLLVDVVLIGFLTLRAYRDADTLDRFEMPIVGRIASRFVDDE